MSESGRWNEMCRNNIKDYYFGSDDAEVVISTNSLNKAEKMLENIVYFPQLFKLKYAVNSVGEVIVPEDIT